MKQLTVSVWLFMGIFLYGAYSNPVFAKENEEKGLVNVRVTFQEYDLAEPWIKKPEKTQLGGAMVVGSGLLLTTADMVRDATLIEVRKFGRYPDFIAKVVLIDYELDLALLIVEDKSFWDDLKPLRFADKPPSTGDFVINRWRYNGRFEQGRGEIIEIRVGTSRFGSLELPLLRGSTNMSGLGWAEVLTANGEIIGLVTSHGKQGLTATLSPVLELFIKAAKKEEYKGLANRGFAWQRLDHPALRESLKLNGDTGILVRGLLSGGTGSKELKSGDILLSIGGYKIDPEGLINHKVFGSILFGVAINESLEEKIDAEIIRNSKKESIQLQRKAFSPNDYRVHPYLFDKPINFIMFGGLVIQELSLSYLRLWGNEWETKAPARLVIEQDLAFIHKNNGGDGKVLIVTNQLPDPANLGYETTENGILAQVNGLSVTTLEQFRNALKTPDNGFQILEMIPGHGRKKMVFKASDMEKINTRIQKRYGLE